MTEKKVAIPLHPMVFSLKAKIDSLEKRLVSLENVNINKLEATSSGQKSGTSLRLNIIQGHPIMD